MLLKGKIAKELYQFMKKQNAKESSDPDKSMLEFCNKIETLIYESIKSATLTIPPGTINVVAPPPTGIGTNPAPIIVKGGIL